MYIDLIASDTFISINRKLAQLFDLKTAAYVAELANIALKVTKKKTFNDEGFFTVNRKYIEERTTLSLDDQLKCDNILNKAGVLQELETDNNQIRVDVATLTALITSEDTKLLADISKKAKATKGTSAAAKKAAILQNLKNRINEPDLEVLAALHNWLETLYGNKKVNNTTVDMFVAGLNEFTNDKNTKLTIIKIATAQNYSEVKWAIDIYNKSYAKSVGTRIATQQKIGTGVNSNITF